MLRGEAKLIVQDDVVHTSEIKRVLSELPDGDYTILVLDDTRNKALPQLKYFCGIVLHEVSKELSGNPSVEALYRYFEDKFAPTREFVLPNGDIHYYKSLKTEKAAVLTKVIEETIRYITNEWHIRVLDKIEARLPEAKEAWAGAYTQQWQDIVSLKQ